MDSGGSGISWKYTTSGNDYKKPDAQATASGSGRYRHGTVRKVNVPPSYIQKRNECHPAFDACSANHPPGHSVKPVHGFNALITPEKMDWLAGVSARYGDRYDGRDHGQFACSIKRYTSGGKRPLNHSEQRQLIPLLHDFKVTPRWSWRSLTATLHSLTSADVLTPHKYLDEGGKETQAALLSTLLDAVIFKCNQKPEARDIDAQGISNLLWALAKMVDNGLELEKTPKLKEAVAALLPHAKTKAESKEEKNHCIPQQIANQLWALAKLVDNGLELVKTPKLKEVVAALLPQVKTKAESKKEKDHFKPQEVANLLWAVTKLVDNGLKLEKTPKLKEAVAALLPHVKTKAESKEEKDHFNTQATANLLWALAKLVDNGLELKKTAQFKEALAALLSRVKNKAESKEDKGLLISQHIVNLLWALAKLVDNGLKLEKTPKLKEAVAALLPHVKTKAESKEEKDDFQPQGVANLLWAVAKLVDNGLALAKTPKIKEVVAELLPHVKNKAEAKEEKDQLIPQHITNLLWAVAKLGEAIELNHVKSTFDFLVDRIRKNPQLSQQDISMSLWGVMAVCARFYLDSGSNNKHSLEKHIGELSSRLENTFPDNTEDQCIIALAASWLGRACPVVPYYTTITSQSQSSFRDHLQSSFPSLKIAEEKRLNSLPPVDLLLPDYNMVIDIQGPFHYVSGDFKTRNGSTLLKIGLLQKLGFEVIEIPVNKLRKQDSMKIVIEQIKARLAVSPEAYGSVSINSDEWVADEAYFTADDGGQFSDDCYFTAEEYSEEQTGKPKRKRKRKKLVKTHLHKH
ncbi:RAP domain-containing protein [Endozoicomonas acroporae]|uniref:RAP domain-containing protein n=1 Tax=Endozoicomonas acroporae TaxID=1701104 RepID=UPI000C771893|nr:RAP domain-containing protein [Endozoicomonas acroporae]